MTDLSPAAQAILDAAEDDCIHPTDLHKIVAAALRAAALYCKRDTLIILSLVDELEAHGEA